ncbi:MAG: hypothetical protein JWQ50_3258 [Caballeronia mineralivorans]|nr:hypothetical protein [Caballeronia mineralivorans]
MRRTDIIEHKLQRGSVDYRVFRLHRSGIIARRGDIRRLGKARRYDSAPHWPHRSGRTLIRRSRRRHGRHKRLGQLETGQRGLTDIGIQHLERGAFGVFGEQIERGRTVGRAAQQRETLSRAGGAGELGIGVRFDRTASRRGRRSSIGTTRAGRVNGLASGIYSGIWHKSMIDSVARRDAERLNTRPMKRSGLAPRNGKAAAWVFEAALSHACAPGLLTRAFSSRTLFLEFPHGFQRPMKAVRARNRSRCRAPRPAPGGR